MRIPGVLWPRVRQGLVTALGMVAIIAVAAVVPFPLHAAHVHGWPVAACTGVATLGAYLAFVRFVEHRRPDELAPRALPEVLGGLFGGIGLFATAAALLAATGTLHVSAGTGWAGAGAALAGALATGTFEEVVFRGLLFRRVRAAAGMPAALAVSAVVFGGLHGFNPGATVQSAVAVALEAGVLLALAYALTDHLWLPIGVHAGWNFAEGSLFGTAVSGLAPHESVLRSTAHGPVLLTGGAFGPEGSVVTVTVCLVATAVLGAVVARRGASPRAIGPVSTPGGL